jgi:hypothetical protein
MSFVLRYRLFAEEQAREVFVHLGAMFTSVIVMTTDVIKRMEGAPKCQLASHQKSPNG